MLKLLKRYTPPVREYRIDLYEHEGPLFRFKATIILVDASRLFIKEYRFSDGSRKYAYHWESANGRLKIRWDNADHWPHIATHPHHKHVAAPEMVEPSTGTDLESILSRIAQALA